MIDDDDDDDDDENLMKSIRRVYPSQARALAIIEHDGIMACRADILGRGTADHPQESSTHPMPSPSDGQIGPRNPQEVKAMVIRYFKGN